MQTATNEQTGERVALVGGEWKPIEKSATNDKGQKAYLVGGAWVLDDKKEGSGALAEAGKGLLRGASDTALAVGKGGANLILGPIGGSVAGEAIDALAAPSRSLVVPNPEGDAAKFAGTAAEIMGAGAAGGGLNSVRSAAMNALSGLTGAAGEQLGGVPGKIIGTLLPTAGSLAGTAVKARLANGAAENAERFGHAGASPSAGQVTESAFLRGLENLISKFPGGQGVMERFVSKQQADLGKPLANNVTAADAGRTIESGVTGFLKRTKETWQKLDDALGAKMETAPQLAPNNTVKTLNTLTAEVPGAEKTTAALANPKLVEITKNLTDDLQANGGVIPFEAMRALRSRIGSMLENSLVSGVPGGELKRVYASLTKDMQVAAEAGGAGKEFARQSAYYSARMDRVENVLERVLGKNRQPEDIFKFVNPTDADQAGKLTAVMRSLEPEERTIVRDAVVNKLGRASAGKQDALGDVWSSETFLTNWNKISDRAKAQLFPETEMRRNMESLAKVAENIRSGAKVFQNPSGTAGSFAAYSVYSSPITAVGAGMAGGATAGMAVLAAALGSATAANIGAKLLTNPKFVQWLAETPRVTSQTMAPHLARLTTIYSDTKDPDVKEGLAKLINSISPTQQAQ